MLRYDRSLRSPWRRLRGAMTDAKQKLLHCLRRKQLGDVQCYRQMPPGRYVVDFHLPAAMLVVEVDGGPNFTDSGMDGDVSRTGWLQRPGLEVLRFDNRQMLLGTDAVVEAILAVILPAL